MSEVASVSYLQIVELILPVLYGGQDVVPALLTPDLMGTADGRPTPELRGYWHTRGIDDGQHFTSKLGRGTKKRRLKYHPA